MPVDRLAPEVLAKGTRVAGYRIHHALGRGPRGIVYEATARARSRTLALKILAAELGEDRAFCERFLADVAAQAALGHRHVVDVFETGESEYGLFVAMRLVRGPNLGDLIAARELDGDRSLRILAQIALALDSSHDAGLVHGSLKPQNILLETPERALLGDFGLAGANAGEALDYLAPEQLRGEELTGRSDVYALAAILHECLTGRAPSTTRRPQPPAVATGGTAQPSQSLERVFDKALASDPEDRPDLAGEVVGGAALAFEAQETPEPALSPLNRESTSSKAEHTPQEAEQTAQEPLSAAAAEPREPRRLLTPIGIGFAALLILVAAFAVGRSSADGQAQPTRPVRAGALALEVPREWQRARRSSELAEVRFSRPVALARGGDPSAGILIAGQVDASGPTLLPASLRRRLEHKPPRKEAVRLGRLEAYRYRNLRLRADDRRLTLYAVPNSGGVATVGCVEGREGTRGFESACARMAASLRLRGRKAYPLGPSDSYASRLGTTVERLRSDRAAALLGRRPARTRSQLARRAGALAAAYERAAAMMRAAATSPADQQVHRRIVAALGRAEGAYREAARWARQGRRRLYDGARAQARAGESALRRAFRRLEQLGYDVRWGRTG